MMDFDSSIIGNPKLWDRPEDVSRRERDMREGISEYRKQRQQEETQRKGLAKAILTPEPAKPSRGFAETYGLHVPENPPFYTDPERPGYLMVWNAAMCRYSPVASVPATYAQNEFPADDDPGS